jgi:hypothetical protein
VLAILTACGGSRENPTGPSASLASPAADSPVGDAYVPSLRPTLTVRNATTSGSGARTYEFQVSERSDFSVVLVSKPDVPEGSGGSTSFTPSTDLPLSSKLHWRARTWQRSSASLWSSTATFRTRLSTGYNRAGELFDPLTEGDTIGTRAGSTTFMGNRGLRVDNANSWVRYELPSTLTSGEISVEVEGLKQNGSGSKGRIFSMMDGGSSLYFSRFLFNVQYRGLNGNPDNAISYKVVMGDSGLQYEPDKAARTAGIRSLDPETTYLWTATWGSTFRLTVREGGAGGPVIYERSEPTSGTYNPSPHVVYLGANDAAYETGSYAGAIYRNFWVGSGPRPPSAGTSARR